jgi:hypothetical protein
MEVRVHLAEHTALFVTVSLFFAFVFWRLMHVNQSSDLASHIEYAKSIKSFSDIYSPHFLFQLTIRLISAALGLSLELSTALLLGVCYGFLAVLIAHRIQTRDPILNHKAAYVSSFLILVASHIFIATVFVPNFYYNYLVPITYHNPTQQLNKLFAIAIWFVYCDIIFSQRCRWTLPRLSLLSVLCVASAVAKPSFLIAFLPISGVIALSDIWRGGWRKVFSYAVAMVPVVMVLLWQFGSHYGASSKGSIVFSPLAVFPSPMQYILMLPMSLAFPIATTAFLWREARASRSLQMAWVFMGIALFYTLFLIESQDVGSGNFAWTAQTGAFLLYVEALLLMMRQRASTGHFKVVPLAVLVVHVLFGFIFAGASAFWPAPMWQ